MKEQKITKAIVKKVSIPLSKKELKQQNDFINYLNNNGFNTAKILNLYKNNENYYEVQEYIEDLKGKDSYTTNDLVKFIASFHKLSKEYSGLYSKKNYYKMKFKCRGTTLDKVLLNFSDKYYVFPMKNYKKSKKLIVDETCIKEVNIIIKNYNKIYNFFIKNYDVKSCIIHNDITSNNVIINNKGFYLIDFDLSIIGTEYVDFIDAIIKRYNSVCSIVENYNDLKENLNMYIDNYNMINNYVKLDIDGSLSVLILKLVAVHLYLLLNKKNINKFLKNNHYIFIFIEKVIKDLEIGENVI